MSPDTTYLLQSLDQVFTETIKAYFLGDHEAAALRKFWGGYSIKKAIDSLGALWEVNKTRMNGAWRTEYMVTVRSRRAGIGECS
jgi:hypothetical protein